MGWGLWSKIKKGFKKVGNAIKKGAKWVNDKIIKPAAPMLRTVGGAIADRVAPGTGDLVRRGIDAFGDTVDAVGRGNYRDAAQNVRDFIQGGRIRLND